MPSLKSQTHQTSAHRYHGGGQNGKGSTCALMEAILLQESYSVGVYSSPHLIRYKKRVRING